MAIGSPLSSTVMVSYTTGDDQLADMMQVHGSTTFTLKLVMGGGVKVTVQLVVGIGSPQIEEPSTSIV